MIPIVFEIGPVKLYSFGLMLAVAFLTIAWLAEREFRRRKFPEGSAGTCVLGAMIGGVLGAKIYFLIDHWAETLADPQGTILSGAGLTFYGGLMGGALGVFLVARHNRIPISRLSDVAGPMIALGYAIGRIGCFLNGDDYGGACDLPWCMSFPKGTPPILETVHPTQLYETFASFAIFFFLWAKRATWENVPGRVWGTWLILAGVERFGVEIWRLNPPIALGLTFAQWISLGLMTLGTLTLIRVLRTSKA
jgi:phosphatidylglycerol:prolipoprotein diacylglycerol transferase